MEELAALDEGLVDQGLAVEVDEIEGEETEAERDESKREGRRLEAELDFDVLDPDLLPGAGGEDLEGQDLLLGAIEGDGLAVEDAGGHALLGRVLEVSDNVGELLRRVVEVAREDEHLAALLHVNLRALAVVLPLSGEGLALEAVEDLVDT